MFENIIYEDEDFKIDSGMITIKIIQKSGRPTMKLKGIEKSYFIQFDMALDRYGIRRIQGSLDSIDLSNETHHQSVLRIYRNLCDAVSMRHLPVAWQSFFVTDDSEGWADECAKRCLKEIRDDGESGTKFLKQS